MEYLNYSRKKSFLAAAKTKDKVRVDYNIQPTDYEEPGGYFEGPDEPDINFQELDFKL